MPVLRKSLYVYVTSLLSIFLAASFASAGSSVNVPVESGVYDDLERLEVKGLLDTALLSTRPFGGLEAARLIREAEEKEASSTKDGQPIISRLESQFKDVLENPGANYVQPIDTFYMRSVYSSDGNPYFLNVNNNGDRLTGGGNLRIGLASSAGVFDTFSFYLNPEYRLDESGDRGALVLGYMTVDLFGATLELGRDSMWWGPGYHGDLLLTNNAQPFDMIKLTSQHPFLLPWIFKYIGLIKPTIFLTHIDKDMNYPRANILGMRLDFKPTDHLEIGLSRLFLNGGHGRQALTLSDWAQLFIASNSAEHSGGPIDGSQMASVDASYVYVNTRRWIPLSGIKVYTEWGFIDSPGLAIIPTGRGDLEGAFIDEPFYLENIDLRIEWANTAHNARYGPLWYSSSFYSTGWRYLGNIIGHHMGPDAKDLYGRVQYHYMEKITVGVESDWERNGFHTGTPGEKIWAGTDVSYNPTDNMTLMVGAGFQDIKVFNTVPNSGAVLQAQAMYYFR